MDDSYTNINGITVRAGDLVVLEIDNNVDDPWYRVGRAWSVTPYEVRIAYKPGHAVDDNWWPLACVVATFDLDALFPTAPEGSTKIAFDMLASHEFSTAMHARLIMQDLQVRGRGPIVEISTGEDGTVGVATYWSAVTFVVFALQSLGISIRMKDPVLDADGNLVLLLSGLNGSAVDPAVVWRKFDEMGFRATLADSTEST